MGNNTTLTRTSLTTSEQIRTALFANLRQRGHAVDGDSNGAVTIDGTRWEPYAVVLTVDNWDGPIDHLTDLMTDANWHDVANMWPKLSQEQKRKAAAEVERLVGEERGEGQRRLARKAAPRKPTRHERTCRQ